MSVLIFLHMIKLVHHDNLTADSTHEKPYGLVNVIYTHFSTPGAGFTKPP